MLCWEHDHARIVQHLELKNCPRSVKQKLRWFANPLFLEGAGSRIRTDDLLITNQLLYQLSYAGKEDRAV